MKLPYHKTKIVCTIGPASRSESVLKSLITAGMNAARLNFSHGTLEEHRDDIHRIRSLAARMGRIVLILIDLPGPKIRIGGLQHEPITLKKGNDVTLTTRRINGTDSCIPVNYRGLPENVSRGSIIYLNDGFIQLKVQEISGTEVRCRVMIGGPLLSRKGLNLPGAKISVDAITATDLDFVDFGLKEGVDCFCISFVEKAEDILKVKEFAHRRGASIHVVAKIERAEAVKNIDTIMDAADAMMVARGDLGVEVPIENIPAIQKRLIRKANFRGRPVITATQMLESMTQNVRPTRAEVTDVANAILDGTDAVMLSEETAIGKYPADAVKMMAKIALSTERHRRAFKFSSDEEDYFKRSMSHKTTTIEDIISLNVVESMRTLNVGFILTPTHTGSTPRHIARFKPDCWNLAFSPNEQVRDFLALSYGVYPFVIKDKSDDWYDAIMKFIKAHGLVKKGDKMILTEGMRNGRPGGTNSMRIITLTS